MNDGLKCEIVSPDDARWSGLLGGVQHDVYQTPEWATLSARFEGGQPIAVLVTSTDGQALFPLLRREVSGGLWDATSPYGYPAPVADFVPTKAALDSIIFALAAEFGSAGCASLFLRLHPWISTAWPWPEEIIRATGRTVSVDLGQDVEEYEASLRKSHRYDVRRSMTRGLTVRLDNSDESIRAFRTIYAATMERVGASDIYLFEEAYFASLRDSFGDAFELHLAHVDDQVVAGAIFLHSNGGTVQYHLSATHPAHLSWQGTKAILDSKIRQSLHRQDLTRLHLGGGRGGSEDSLLHFKRGFGSSEHVFRTLGIVLNKDAYAELCRVNGTNPNPDFFPAYRGSAHEPAGAPCA